MEFRSSFRSRVLVGAPGIICIAVLLFATAAFGGSVPNPTISGPIPATAIPGSPSHNYPWFASNHDLPTHGYVEEEYFFAGTANRYNTPSLTTATIIDSGHPYMTRLVVRRPANPRDFNGTVLVEWYNVTSGWDQDNIWFFDWEHIMDSGYIWVGVSAQRVGVNWLKTWNPTRYGALDVTQGGTITDDSLSYDIFSQAGQAILHPQGKDVLNGMKPKVVLAMGESQSASRLATYANSIQPLANLYPGILLQSSLGNLIRTDLTIPVWKMLTEFDVANAEAIVRQPDTKLFRTWEVAGTSHVDQHFRASKEYLEIRDNVVSSEGAFAPECGVPSIGTRVPFTYALSSAIDLFVRWVKYSVPPPTAPRIGIATLGSPGVMSVIARNSLGLALGGIQLAQIAVPTALNVGINSGPSTTACVRWGYSIPFDVNTLEQLYPSHQGYVGQVANTALQNVKQGYISDQDAQRTILCAVNSNVGGGNNGEAPSSLMDLYCSPYF
jgi:hypothetical protein